MDIYLQGLTMGLAYVAPIGLQNLFVINTALTQPRRRVFLTALIDFQLDTEKSAALSEKDRVRLVMIRVNQFLAVAVIASFAIG